MKIVTLLTDFGTADGYVAAMKGVILTASPDAQIIDAAHDIPAHDVRAGAWSLRHYWNLYPEGTIHLAVVDPGVGSARRALLARADGRWLTGPDNGIFSWVLRAAQKIEVWSLKSTVRRTANISSTFHGRDVFAHAAGLLAAGAPPRELAERTIRPRLFAWPQPTRTAMGICGVVVHIDRFGNAITNIPASMLKGHDPSLEIECGPLRISGVSQCYADASPGRPLALIESTGLLELAICEGNAAKALSLKAGDRVLVKNCKKNIMQMSRPTHHFNFFA